MRENRTSGSEGRESETNRTSLPLSFPSAVETSVDVELIIPIRPRYPALARRRDEVNEFLIVIDAQIEQ